MGVLDFLRRGKSEQFHDKNLEHKVSKVGSIQIPDSITDKNAFILANTLAELYHPIDFLADRASKLRFYIADKSGNEVVNTELNRFITDINPLFSFSELFYQSIFSYYGDGNVYGYLGVPSSYANITQNNITRFDILQPNMVCLDEFSNINLLKISNYNDVIRRARYYYSGLQQDELEKDKLNILLYDNIKRDDSTILCKSPIFKAYRSVNNLLATYSARYNVYANNGAAGYLARKSTVTSDFETINDTATREGILKDLNNSYGITGNKSLWGLSGTPIEFINTLIDIQKLMPFEETLEDSIKIAATLQLPSGLVPRKDQPKYNNQDADEKQVWENALISVVNTHCDFFTKSFRLKGYSIKADFESVSALKVNEIAVEDLKTKKIANLVALKNAGEKVDNQIKKIAESYE